MFTNEKIKKISCGRVMIKKQRKPKGVKKNKQRRKTEITYLSHSKLLENGPYTR
jgi:hypothetical protein